MDAQQARDALQLVGIEDLGIRLRAQSRELLARQATEQDASIAVGDVPIAHQTQKRLERRRADARAFRRCVHVEVAVAEADDLHTWVVLRRLSWKRPTS